MYQTADIIRCLQTIPWFLELKPQSLERLATIAHFANYEAGEMLFREGERAADLYIILEGQVELHSYVPSFGPVTIFTADPLDIVGWSSLTNYVHHRTAEAVTVCPTRVVVLDGEGMRRLCDQDYDMGYIIMKRMTNVIASHLLTTRLHLYNLLIQCTHNSDDDLMV